MYVLPQTVLEKSSFVQLRRQLEERDGRLYHFPYSIFNDLNSKSGTSTLKQVWFRQLACIRGVSVEKANTIVTAYPTPQSLLDALYALPTNEERLRLLKQVNGPVQRKNLGEAVLKKMIDLFCSLTYTD